MSHESSTVTVIRYSETQASREHLEPEQPLPEPKDGEILWINVDGVQHSERLQEFRKLFGLHSMVLEDLRSEEQRSKVEVFPSYTLVITHMIALGEGDLEVEQFSLILGPNFLLTFQEKPGDMFAHIRKRISNGGGRVRKRKSDYLMYVLLDALVSHQLSLLETMEGRSEALEQELLLSEQAYRLREKGTLRKVYQIRVMLSYFRQVTRPLREMFTNLMEEGTPLIEERTRVYLRDTYDSVRYMADSVDNLREMLQGLIDLHMTQVNNRMSEVMKVLAMISTIFMPLNLIAAVYGMNFKYMPELEIRGFYFGVVGVMLVIAILMYFYFKRKRWV